ncbi:unnamed protein product [Paramecium primaurelia]|uniref:Uncharacterized protein n=1 Tax=Paramecium primaurelia TaxID=5886 RepID=A0A8S1PGT6_PARPR|nr:unnamed protein product [Paramecium primaurelia]CAD8102313.1 unnamed protein product [Paramecium primaurelia]CAD8102315.1 unnamed protein product [Paramecium primaurelia]
MKNIIAATLTSLLICVGFYQVNLDSDSEFERWALKHGKRYFGDEKTYRQTIYFQNKQMIDEHNKRTDVTYLMGENQFMAITNEEFVSLYLNPLSPEKQNEQDQIISKTNPKSPEPNIEQNQKLNIDWRGYAPVKNTGNCASSWAMAATNVIEAKYKIEKGITVTLSPQNAMDCAGGQGSCDGTPTVFTQPQQAYEHARIQGLLTESEYPYTGTIQWCKQSGFAPWKIMAYHQNSDDIDYMRGFTQMLNDQPLSVRVDATNWQFYSSGVFSLCSSLYKNSNYYALAIGQEYTVDSYFWRVQASFGISWGEFGTIRLAPGNTCGLINESYMVLLW